MLEVIARIVSVRLGNHAKRTRISTKDHGCLNVKDRLITVTQRPERASC